MCHWYSYSLFLQDALIKYQKKHEKAFCRFYVVQDDQDV